MRRFIYATIIIAIFFSACQTDGNTRRGGHGSSWDDAMLVAEQRLELERQRQLIADLERIIQSGSDALTAATQYLGELGNQNLDLDDWLQRVDGFVRSVIGVQQQLDRVQQTESGANAGT